VFVISNPAEREAVRSQVSFYASTPSYRAVLDCHGWGETGERLSHLQHGDGWEEMPREISDEMLDAFAYGRSRRIARQDPEPLCRAAGSHTLYRPFVRRG